MLEEDLRSGTKQVAVGALIHVAQEISKTIFCYLFREFVYACGGNLLHCCIKLRLKIMHECGVCRL